MATIATISEWANVGLALSGLGLIAGVGAWLAPPPQGIVAHAMGLIAIVAVLAWVYAWALRREGYALTRLGFGRLSWLTPVLAFALTLFFTLVYGPFAYWMLNLLGGQDFSAGLARLQQLPTAYLVATIIIVGAAEEMLYRGYAIERLADLTGSYGLAGMVSVAAFFLAHVPLWGWAAASTTIFSGAVLTLIYLWRRDVVTLSLAHIATDLYGIILVQSSS